MKNKIVSLFIIVALIIKVLFSNILYVYSEPLRNDNIEYKFIENVDDINRVDNSSEKAEKQNDFDNNKNVDYLDEKNNIKGKKKEFNIILDDDLSEENNNGKSDIFTVDDECLKIANTARKTKGQTGRILKGSVSEEYVKGELLILVEGGIVEIQKEINNLNNTDVIKKNVISKLKKVLNEDYEIVISLDEDDENGYEEIIKLKFDNDEIDYIKQILSDLDCVVSVEKNIIRKLNSIADNTHLQYYLPVNGSEKSQKISKLYQSTNGSIEEPNWDMYNGNIPSPLINTKDIVVAVMDSGIDVNHPDLKNVMYDMSPYTELNKKYNSGKYGYSPTALLNNTSTAQMSDTIGHGTHVSGIIAAEWNKFGVSGVASGVKLIGVKVDDLTDATIMKGYSYLIDAKNAGVPLVAINCSWGGEYKSLMLQRVITKLGKLGVVSVIASGNEDVNSDYVESVITGIDFNNPYTIVVNASNSDGDAINYDTSGSWGSNYGMRNTDLFAPGMDIISTYPTNMVKPDMRMEGLNGKSVNGKNLEEWFDSDGYVVDEKYYKGKNIDIDLLHTGTAVPKLYTDANLSNKTYGFYDANNNTTGGLKLKLTENMICLRFNFKQDIDYKDMPKWLSFTVKNNDSNKDQIICDPVFMVGYLNATNNFVAINNAAYSSTNAYGWGNVCIAPNYSAIPKGANLAIVIYSYLDENQTKDIYIDKLTFLSDAIPYKFLSGTSMATPVATGVIANIYQMYLDRGYSVNNDTALKVIAIAKSSTKKMNNKYKNRSLTSGIINLNNAVKMISNGKYIPFVRNVLETKKEDGNILVDVYGEFFDNKTKIKISKANNETNCCYINNINLISDNHLSFNVSDEDFAKIGVGEVEIVPYNDNGSTRMFFVHNEEKSIGFKNIEIKNDFHSAFFNNEHYIMQSIDDTNYIYAYDSVNHKGIIYEAKGTENVEFLEFLRDSILDDIENINSIVAYNKNLLIVKSTDDGINIYKINVKTKEITKNYVSLSCKAFDDCELINTGKYLICLIYYYNGDGMKLLNNYISFINQSSKGVLYEASNYKLNNLVTDLVYDNKGKFYGFNSDNNYMVSYALTNTSKINETVYNIKFSDNEKNIKNNNILVISAGDRCIFINPAIVDENTDEIIYDNYYCLYNDLSNVIKNNEVVSKYNMFNLMATVGQNNLYIFALTNNYDGENKGYIYRYKQLANEIKNPADKIYYPSGPDRNKKDTPGGGGSSGGGGGGGGGAVGSAAPLVEFPSYVSTSGAWEKNALNQYMYKKENNEYVKSSWLAIAWKTWKNAEWSSGYEWFHFNENGIMEVGWFKDIDNNIYYLDTSPDNLGVMLTGWKYIDGQDVYFSEGQDGRLLGSYDPSKRKGV